MCKVSTWSWISRISERRALELYIKHASKVLETVNHAIKALKAYYEGQREMFAEEWRKVFDSEKEADVLKRKIIEELSTQTFHPIDREEVVRLVLSSDDIASRAKAWTRRLTYAQDSELPRYVVEHLVKMAVLVGDAVKLIVEAGEKLLQGDVKSVLKLAEDIERLEERVDDLRSDALSLVFAYCDTAKPSLCILAKEVLDIIEDAADKCEDVADVLRSIALLR